MRKRGIRNNSYSNIISMFSRSISRHHQGIESGLCGVMLTVDAEELNRIHNVKGVGHDLMMLKERRLLRTFPEGWEVFEILNEVDDSTLAGNRACGTVLNSL